MSERQRDYAYEALAEVTASDLEVSRGQLNSALRDIRTQEPALASTSDSYLLSAEIHERAKMYRAAFPEVALTPTALAKHWVRVKAETKKVRGANLHADREPVQYPPSRREENLAAARQAMKELWG